MAKVFLIRGGIVLNYGLPVLLTLPQSTDLAPYLKECTLIVPELVIVLDLHSNGLVTVNVAQLNVGGVGHVVCPIEASGSEASTGPHSHHAVKPHWPR